MRRVRQKSRSKRRLLLWAAILLLGVAALCVWYSSDYYRADPEAVAAFAPADGVQETVLADGTILLQPQQPIAGFIFYPGGKVESIAYLPLMRALAARGVLCALPSMPLHLAVLDMDAAAPLREMLPQELHWYLGGHSLGGAMAAAYLAEHTGDYCGLVLLAAYATVDLSQSGLSTLSIYGSEDTVLDAVRYAECRTNLPQNGTELVLEGGCHAGFGCYGPQAGDGVPTISAEAQIAATADAVCAFVAENNRNV